MHSKKAEVAEVQLITAKNKEIWVRICVQADCSNGVCTRLYGTLEDITQIMSLLDTLAEQEKRFHQAFDHAPIGMALVSLTGGWIKVNRSLTKILGYDEHTILQHTFQDYTHPDDLNSDLEQLSRLLKGEIDSYAMEKRYYHANGHIIWALLSVSLVSDDWGNPLYFVSQIKDISERKRNSETIRAQNGRLLNFAHIVSHNLRSHTGNIQMLTHMIISEENHEEQMKLVGMLNINADNLLETLMHLNEVVKVHDDGQTNKVRLNLLAEVQRVIDFLSATIMQTEAEVLVDVPADIEVHFNPAYLESILINLLTNTFKYQHAERHPEIEIQAKVIDRHTLMTVKDNGLGIDLALHGHKIFGMYKTFHRHSDARGMGLFLVKNQVEAMGGRISVASEPEKGSTFTVEFDNS